MPFDQGSTHHSAFAHGLDFYRILELEEFDTIIRKERDMMIKPVVVFTVDGVPDENPHYQKVIEVAIHHFVKSNLDVFSFNWEEMLMSNSSTGQNNQ